jgi:DnaK suppressor protein
MPGPKKAAPKKAGGTGPSKKKTGAKRLLKTVEKHTRPAKTTSPDAGKSTLDELRKGLLKRKDAILKEAKTEIAKYMSGENRQLVDTALDDGDWAVVDISEDINLMRLMSHRKAMHDIDESLRKIAEGTYGICEECGEPISERRLTVIPTATLCISCQENKERFEAVEREEGA